jgi:AraC-like DNA-binding protein
LVLNLGAGHVDRVRAEVFDEVRKSLALDCLESSDLPLQQIAALLDYEEPANFNRAFRKWVGDAPGRYRRRMRTHGGR